MAFKKLNGTFENYPTLRVDEFVDQETTFTLVDYREGVGKFKNHVYTVDVNGVRHSLWGNTQLNKYLPELEMGSIVHVIYRGEVAGKGGGNPYKNFDIFVDDGKPGDDERQTAAPATTAPATAEVAPAAKRKTPVPF